MEYYKIDYFNNLQQPILKMISIIICVILSFVCQIGDLVISYFKRKAKGKRYRKNNSWSWWNY